jgi:hypothetical protein
MRRAASDYDVTGAATALTCKNQLEPSCSITHVSTLILQAKERYSKDRVTACAGNQQQLFRSVSTLLGRSSAPPLPSGDSPSLAQRFSDYFMAKIDTNQKSIKVAQPPALEVNTWVEPLTHFSPITLDELVRLIRSSPNKQCELDPIPTQLY